MKKHQHSPFRKNNLFYWIGIIIILVFQTSCRNSNTISNVNLDNEFLTFIAEQDSVLDDLLPQRAAERNESKLKEMGKWNNESDKYAKLIVEFHKSRLEKANAFDISKLSEFARTQYKILKFESELEVERGQFRVFDKAFSANYFSSTPALIQSWMRTKHKINSDEEANAYIERLSKIPSLFRQIKENIISAKSEGIVSSFYELERAKNDYRQISNDILENNSTLNADINNKFSSQNNLTNFEKLKKEAIKILSDSVAFAYQDLAGFLEKNIQPGSEKKMGLWQYGDKGLQFYHHLIKVQTSLDLTPEYIIELGKTEVDRIECQIRQLMIKDSSFYIDNKQKDTITLRKYFDHYRERGCISSDSIKSLMELQTKKMHPKWEELFEIEIPEVEIQFDPFEGFAREELDFGQTPPKPIFSLNGKAPKCLYTDWDMMELLTHEGVPGHGLEQLYTHNLSGLPKFRKNFSINAYSEGWALYAEYLAKEIGFYDNIEHEFGRLSSSLFRACRLVVDANLHTGKMTKETATEYLYEHSPYINFKLNGQVLRYSTYPAQATSYYVGANEIWSLRHKAEAELMNSFDIREFHAAILENGNLPLDLLKEKILEWIDSIDKKNKSKELNDVKYVIYNHEEARKFLIEEDDFIKNLTVFDMQGRMKSLEAVSKQQYLDFLGSSSKDFSDNEIKLINYLMNHILEKIAGLNINFPSNEVVVIKTSGEEEGQTAYTRKNGIIFPQNYLKVYESKCESREEMIKRVQGTLIHEIWHIISRYNPELKLKSYETLGFTPCEVSFPDSLAARRVTNPDAISCNYCYTVIYHGKKLTVAPFLYADGEYRDKEKKKEFFKFIVSVQKTGKRHPSLFSVSDGRILNTMDVENYNDTIFGTGSEYLFHPEEVCAEHFEKIILESPPYEHQFTEKLAQILFNHKH